MEGILLNENNQNDQNNSQSEDTVREDVRSEKKEYDNPYAKFISKDEDGDSRQQLQSENPYSNYYRKSRDGEEKNQGQNQGQNQGDNPYSKYYGKEQNFSQQNQSANGNPYSEYYKEQSRPSWGDDFKVNEDYTQAPLIDEDREKHNFSRIGLGFALFSVVSLAVSFIIQFIVLSVNSEIYSSTLFLNLLTPISLYLFALPVLLIILSRCEAKAPEKKKMGFGKFILFLIAAFGFMYIGSLVGNALMDTLSELVGYDYGNALNRIIDEDHIWITAIFTVIVAPIGEEFVFRKLLIDRTQKYGPFISIGLSGLMFGLIHANFYQFFYAFALGLLLGYVYYSTGKLYLTVAIHAIVNFVGSVLTSFLSPVIEEFTSLDTADAEAMITFVQDNLLGIIGIAIFDIFVYGAMVCAVIFPIVFRKKLRLPKGEIVIPKNRVVPVVVLNVGIITMLIIYTLEFGLNLLPI